MFTIDDHTIIDHALDPTCTNIDASRELRDDRRGFRPAALRIEVAIDVHTVAIRRESARDRIGIETLDRVTATREHRVAVVLESARLHRGTREERHAGFVKQRAWPRRIPASPTYKRLLAENRVVLVGAVVHADDLA